MRFAVLPQTRETGSVEGPRPNPCLWHCHPHL